LDTQLVKTGLYLSSGGGGNSLLRFSASGTILVNGKAAGAYKPLMSQIRKLSRLGDLPLRVLVLTDHHPEHTANNAEFLAARVPIVAHDRVAGYLKASAPSIPGPTVTYSSEYPIKMGGVEVQLLHVGRAHTDADTIVYFPNLRVVAVGDLFSQTPTPDFAAGGSLVNWPSVLSQILKLDFDVVVPSRGPVVTRADLEKLRSRIVALVSRGTELVKSGVPKDQLMARLQASDAAWRLTFTGADLDKFYAELSLAK
jgi:glyoxylase-like metal-dependent hydrolase (beta-lactamase superfamily II)